MREFFETVGQPMMKGRGITEQDTATTQKVAVVNQAFVKKFFPKEDPIGTALWGLRSEVFVFV